MNTATPTITRYRSVAKIVQGMPASDGAGVKLTRIIGAHALNVLDPFLLLDEFRSDQAQDYIAGFPDHPHRGFETVTYMLAGRMRHEDNQAYKGIIEAGGVQWMSAGRGIVHSEMPEQEKGLLWGFQLWINLPASQKMKAPNYQEFNSKEIAQESREGDVSIKVVVGTTAWGTIGPVEDIPTQLLYLDIALPKGSQIQEPLPQEANAFVYVYQGEVQIISPDHPHTILKQRSLGVLEGGDGVHIKAEGSDARVLLLAALPINEPIARGGPFVMNTRAEVLQAFEDFEQGRF